VGVCRLGKLLKGISLPRLGSCLGQRWVHLRLGPLRKGQRGAPRCCPLMSTARSGVVSLDVGSVGKERPLDEGHLEKSGKGAGETIAAGVPGGSRTM
jgi:hypothetical protein